VQDARRFGVNFAVSVVRVMRLNRPGALTFLDNSVVTGGGLDGTNAINQTTLPDSGWPFWPSVESPRAVGGPVVRLVGKSRYNHARQKKRRSVLRRAFCQDLWPMAAGSRWRPAVMPGTMDHPNTSRIPSASMLLIQAPINPNRPTSDRTICAPLAGVSYPAGMSFLGPWCVAEPVLPAWMILALARGQLEDFSADDVS